MTSTQRTGGSALSGDLWGGLAAMLVALPSAIAFGVLIYTAIAPNYAGEGALAGILGAAALGIVAPRGTAVVGHAFLDVVTIAALVTVLMVMLPWHDGEIFFGPAWERSFGSREFNLVAIMTLCLTLMQWPAWWRADRSGNLPDIDAIRDGSGLLTRFLVANFALLLGLPWLGGGAADLVATLALVGLRTAWTVWFDARALAGREG